MLRLLLQEKLLEHASNNINNNNAATVTVTHANSRPLTLVPTAKSVTLIPKSKKPAQPALLVITEVLLAVKELINRYPTLPNVYLIRDELSGEHFIPLWEADTADFEVVAHYQLQHFACLFHLDKQDSYNPHLESGCWELVPNTNKTGQLLPAEIWHCRECCEFTAANGNEELLACSACGYILYED